MSCSHFSTFQRNVGGLAHRSHGYGETPECLKGGAVFSRLHPLSDSENSLDLDAS